MSYRVQFILIIFTIMSTGITDYSNGNYTHQTDIDKYLNNDDNDTSGNISSPGVSVSITMKVNDVSELEILEQEIDVDFSLVIEITFNRDLICRDAKKLPEYYNVSPPRPGVPSYVRSTFPDTNQRNLWFPNLFYVEANELKFPSRILHTYSRVYSTSVPLHEAKPYQCSAKFFIRRIAALSCALEFADYPLDTQRCYMTITRFDDFFKTYTSLQWKISPAKSLISNPSIVQSEYSLRITDASEGLGKAERRIVFEFSRNLMYQLQCTILPSLFVVEISFGVYLMAPEMITERITLSSNSLLVLFQTFVHTRSMVPPSNSVTYMDLWMFLCLLTVLLVTIECCLVEQLSTSELEFEERRKRRETDLRNKDDVCRYVMRFKNNMKQKSRVASFGPAVVSPDPEFRRPPSEIVTRRRSKRISHSDLERAVKGLIWYIDKATPWYQLPWTAETVDLWTKRCLIGAFHILSLMFWIYIIIIKFQRDM